MLTVLLDHFEQALATAEEDLWDAAGRELDAFLSQLRLEEGEWQPPLDGLEPGS